MRARAGQRGLGDGVRSRRAILLLEVLTAFTVFAFGAITLIGVVRRAADIAWRESERQRAGDLAWSTMAKLEAGIESTLSASGPVAPNTDPAAGVEGFDESSSGLSPWEVAVETTPSPFAGLTLVEVSAIRVGLDGEELWRYTARQLVRLGDTPGGDAGLGQADDLQRAIDRAGRRAPASRGLESGASGEGGAP